MEITYCDNCGFQVAPDALSAGNAIHAKNGKIYCPKCATLYKDTTTAIQKIQLPSKALGADEPTGEFTAVKETAPAQSVTKFYFCETCGKRITDRQILEGLGRDKKLKGVYCRACAVGVMTMEFEAISEADLRKPIRKSGGNTIPVNRESPLSGSLATTATTVVLGNVTGLGLAHGAD